MVKKDNDDSLWQQDGKFMLTVYYGGEGRMGQYIIKADTYGQAIQKPSSFSYLLKVLLLQNHNWFYKPHSLNSLP